MFINFHDARSMYLEAVPGFLLRCLAKVTTIRNHITRNLASAIITTGIYVIELNLSYHKKETTFYTPLIVRAEASLPWVDIAVSPNPTRSAMHKFQRAVKEILTKGTKITRQQ